MSTLCPVCHSDRTATETNVDGYDFFGCEACGSIYLDPRFLVEFDEGRPLRDYDASYWVSEDEAAKGRAYGVALIRVAETLLYARRPVDRFIDLGAGAGYLLDSLGTYLPHSKATFWGIERFPPAVHSTHPNYIQGSIGDLTGKFDAGVCIEVVEHLTPNQLRTFARELAGISEPDSLYLFNTGLPHYVRSEAYTYLDPVRRGHIMSYSLKAMSLLFEPFGFFVHELKGKDWAYLVEYRPQSSLTDPILDRIWSARSQNLALLNDPTMGNVLYCAALDAARAYR